MTEQKRTSRNLANGVAALALTALVGCGDQNRTDRAPVDYRGSTPGGGNSTGAPPPQDVTSTRPVTGGIATGGIVQRDGAAYAIAEDGDTVASLAARHGLSASQLAGYNGLTPDSRLQRGQDLVLPPGAAPAVAAVPGVADSRIEERPLGPASNDGGIAVAEDGSIIAPPDGTGTGVSEAGAPERVGPPTGWTPDLAAAAIDAAAGGTTTESGRIGAPPSSTDPVPPEPRPARDLASPGLGQYQTPASTGDPAANASEVAEERVAAANPAPAAATAPSIRLTRPVDGPVAVGFREGAGTVKNDGIDFSAPAGAPVVAAADGEVALISETLGGLGTIVLVRHQNELLTVYGRVDGVTVKKGDIVRRGQRIGVVSDAAAPAEPRLHFEVRRGATVLDPMPFL